MAYFWTEELDGETQLPLVIAALEVKESAKSLFVNKFFCAEYL